MQYKQQQYSIMGCPKCHNTTRKIKTQTASGHGSCHIYIQSDQTIILCLSFVRLAHFTDRLPATFVLLSLSLVVPFGQQTLLVPALHLLLLPLLLLWRPFSRCRQLSLLLSRRFQLSPLPVTRRLNAPAHHLQLVLRRRWWQPISCEKWSTILSPPLPPSLLTIVVLTVVTPASQLSLCRPRSPLIQLLAAPQLSSALCRRPLGRQ